MAWTVVPDSDIDPDSPVPTGLMTASRDNVASAFAKDSGAPVLADGYVDVAMLVAPTVGDYIEHARVITAAEVDALVGTTYAPIAEMRIARAGTYRIRSSGIGTAAGSDNFWSKVYKNGGAIGAEQTGISRVTQNETFAFVEGDLVQLYAKTQNAAQLPDGSFYLMVLVANPLLATTDYTEAGYP